MRNIEITAYQYSELSDKAKEKAHQDYLGNMEYHWASENEAVLNEFAKIFPVEITDWRYDSNNSDVNFRFTENGDIEGLSGMRLSTYLINNYWDHLFVGRYRSMNTIVDEIPYRHPCVRWKKINYGPNKGKFYNSYKSRVFFDENTLTGYCVGYDILKPVFNFLKNPEPKTTFYDLMEDCLNAWGESCSSDCEYQESEEYFAELCESNEWEFDEDGDQL